MKLDPDCLRDILLSIEKHSTINDYVNINDFANDGLLEKYDDNKLAYHVRYAEEADLFTKVDHYMGDTNSYDIQDLSPTGHSFLSNIRKEDNWNKTKSTAQKIGSFSLDALKSIAEGVTTAAINKHLGN